MDLIGNYGSDSEEEQPQLRKLGEEHRPSGATTVGTFQDLRVFHIYTAPLFMIQS